MADESILERAAALIPGVGKSKAGSRQKQLETIHKKLAALAKDVETLAATIAAEAKEAMAKAGADVLIPHMGLTTKGSIGAKSALTLEDAAKRVQSLHDAAKKVNPDLIVLCHGGPISEPADAAYILQHTKGVVGFFGASSIERLPTEVAITDCVRRFKSIH